MDVKALNLSYFNIFARSKIMTHQSHTITKRLLSALIITLTLGAQTAKADGWPSSVVGAWNVRGNQWTGVLTITSQATTGLCRFISGHLSANPIEGFYCPYSGRLSFVAKLPANNFTYQTWSGNLSQTGSFVYIGGSFAAVTAAGGSPGEYNFSAYKAYP